jgi:hypothetical protein
MDLMIVYNVGTVLLIVVKGLFGSYVGDYCDTFSNRSKLLGSWLNRVLTIL